MNSLIRTIRQILGTAAIFAVVLIIVFAHERISAPVENLRTKTLSTLALNALDGVDDSSNKTQEASTTSVTATTSSTLADATFADLNGAIAKVDRVVDGDTIVIEYNSKVYKVRLIGLNTPETVDPRRVVECFGKEASLKAKQLLAGQTVGVELDPSQGFKDKYQRVLAYIFIQEPGATTVNTQAPNVFFNKYMIDEGYGYEYTYDKPYEYQKEFKLAQAQAKSAGKGLWAPGVCAQK